VIVGNTAVSSAEGNDLLPHPQRTQAAVAAEGPYGDVANLGAIAGSAGPFVAAADASSVSALVNAPAGDVSSVVGPSQALLNGSPERSGIARYKVKKGDTLSGIAATYGITLTTLKAANPGVADPLRRGQALVILPVSGELYTTAASDTLASVADRFGVDPQAIEQYNPNCISLFGASGRTVIVPSAD